MQTFSIKYTHLFYLVQTQVNMKCTVSLNSTASQPRVHILLQIVVIEVVHLAVYACMY